MSLGRLIYERIEEAATRHLETAPIAIHAMHPSDIAQSLFRRRKSSSTDQDFSDEPENIATREDNRCLFEDCELDEEPAAASALVSVSLATYAALQEGDAHG
jgi:hypothetical protein